MRTPHATAALALACAAFALSLSVVPAPAPRPVAFEPAAGGGPSAEGSSRKLWADGPLRRAEYAFVSFNGDPLVVRAAIPGAEVAASVAEYGYRTDAPMELQHWYEREWEAVGKRHRERWADANARSNALEQAAVDRWNAAEREAVARFNAAAARTPASQAAPLHARLAADRAASNERLAADRAERDRVIGELRDQLNRQRDADYAAVEAERARRRSSLYTDAGYRLQGNQLEVDMHGMVRRNAPRLRPVAAEFFRLAKERRYSIDGAVDAIVAMVQTALEYRVPPNEVEGRRTGGIVPPPLSFTEGWGDCDTKSALAAAILAHFDAVQMIGVTIERPPHYLLAVRRVPQQGDTYLEYGGLPYVLVEAAGPGAFRPGTAGPDTMGFLRAGGRPQVEAL